MATSEIKFLSLQKTELTYEVAVRGDLPSDTVEGLRRQIVKLSMANPSDDILESHLDVATDLNEAALSLAKLEKNIQSLQTKFEQNQFTRASNLLNQITYRINRINCSENVEALATLNVLQSRIKTFKSLISDLKSEDAQPRLERAAGEPAAQISVSCDRGLSSDFSKLKFDGKTCPRAFIVRINEFLEARSIPYGKLLAYGTEIFTGDALHWFRSVKSEVTSWSELATRLKDDFGSSDFDYRFQSEIRARTQGDKENITIYLSIMAGMFSQLDKKLSEEDQLEILLHNIRPSYASVLSSCTNINSIDALRTVCKNYENIQTRLSHFHEPARVNSQTLAPEFAYSHAATSQNYTPKPTYYNNSRFTAQKTNFNPQLARGNNFDASVRPTHPVHSVGTGQGKQFCVRCRVDTHTLTYCKAKRFLICFSCGLRDFTILNCPVCNKTTNSPVSKN